MLSETLPGFDDPFIASRPRRIAAQTLLAAALVVLVWVSAMDRTSNPMFHPHGYCYLWEPSLVGAHVISDGIIGTSYLAISLTLGYLIYRVRHGVPFSWMFLV